MDPGGGREQGAGRGGDLDGVPGDCRWELSTHQSAETPQPWHRKSGRTRGDALQIRKGEKRQQIPSHGRPALLWECVSAGVLVAELSR